MELKFEIVDLSQFMLEIVERYRSEFDAAQCEVRLTVEPNLRANCDRSRIEQVLGNLFSNAVKFGSRKPVDISAVRDGALIHLTVRDHGIGIRKEDQGRIFERYQRGVSVMRFGGLGLGLYISQQIVNAHQGRIRLASHEGEGSTFTVDLPAMEESKAA